MAVLLWTHCSQGSAALLRALRARDDGAGPSRPAGVYWPPTPKGVQATVPIPELQRRYLMVITRPFQWYPSSHVALQQRRVEASVPRT